LRLRGEAEAGSNPTLEIAALPQVARNDWNGLKIETLKIQ